MNFPLILFVLVVFTGILWVIDKLHWSKQRKAKAQSAVEDYDRTNAEAVARADAAVMGERSALYARLVKQPWWLDYTADLFPVILIVFLLRSFLFEPFRIPSGSMLPTLYVGDFILVNKYSYGVRLPVVNTKIIPIGSPQRGDVVVFRYPPDESVDYIKRVVGLPGDTVQYINKRLYINGTQVPVESKGDWVDPNTMITLSEFSEKLGEQPHRAVVDNRMGPGLRGEPYPEARRWNACEYYDNGFSCKVPQGTYFMMGDNRDNSDDSRYWGFVPDKNLVGKAVLIWANFTDMSRVGTFH